VSFSESPHVVPDYIVKPLVTQFYSRCGAPLSDAPASSDELSSDMTSSSVIEDVPSSPTDSSPEQLVRRSHCLHRPPDCYFPSAFTVTTLSEPASYHDTILHLKWQYSMTEESTALDRTDMWDLVPCPPCVRPITCKWIYKVKTRFDGSLECYKAHLVAHGF
jgi:hypothetical protein